MYFGVSQLLIIQKFPNLPDIMWPKFRYLKCIEFLFGRLAFLESGWSVKVRGKEGTFIANRL